MSKTRTEQLADLLMWATIMSRDATTTEPAEYARALVVRAFWNEVCHQVANALAGSSIAFEDILRTCGALAIRDNIQSWKFVEQRVGGLLAPP